MIETGDFTADLLARKVRRDGRDVRITPTEWHLLEILITRPGRPISQRRLLIGLWGLAYADKTDHLRVHRARLRRKLEADPTHPRYLITEPGMGYRFEG